MGSVVSPPVGAMRSRRLDSLTSLRFFAAFGVVLYHCALYMPEVMEQFLAVVQYGHVGVTFFFLLSGFVLTWSRRTDDSRRNFYVRRFARVWPSHVVATALAVPAIILASEPVLWTALPAVILLVHAWIPPGTWHYAFNGPSWSLSAEAFFYALFPFLISIASWSNRKIRLLAGFLALALFGGGLLVGLIFPEFTWGFLLSVNPAYRVCEFALGVILALSVERGLVIRIGLAQAVWFLGISYVSLALLAGALHWGELAAFIPALAMLPGFSALIIAAAQKDSQIGTGPFLSNPSMLRLGEISFALYLVHAPLIHTAVTLLKPLHLPDWVWTLVVVPLVATALGAAWILHRFVEVPAEAYIRRRYVRTPTSVALPALGSPSE